MKLKKSHYHPKKVRGAIEQKRKSAKVPRGHYFGKKWYPGGSAQAPKSTR